MKKITLVLTGLFAVVVGFSQTSNSGKTQSSNTGVVEPTINGKPYSQYKAEQEALKQQQSVANKVVLSGDGASNGTGIATKSEPAVSDEKTFKPGPAITYKLTDSKSNMAVTEATKPAVKKTADDEGYVPKQLPVPADKQGPTYTRPVPENMPAPVKADFAKSNADGNTLPGAKAVEVKPVINNQPRGEQTAEQKGKVTEVLVTKAQASVEPVQSTGNVPPSVSDTRGTNGNSNGTSKEVKPAEQKAVDTNVPGAKTKTE